MEEKRLKAMKKAKRSKKKKGKAPKKGEEDEPPPKVLEVEVEPDDIIRPKHVLKGHQSCILDMKVEGNYLYTGSDD